uniref:Protein RFT1 homolog n=1 Tax=Syphacia muris TaxID=451379 RepID=A0A0N5A7X8_9BILA
MGADVCIEVSILIILYFAHVFYEIYNEAVPITNLPSKTVKDVIKLSKNKECPFFIHDDSSDCLLSYSSEVYIAAGSGVPVSFLRRLEAYAPKHTVFNYLSIIGDQLLDIAEVVDSIFSSKIILVHIILVLLGKHIVLTVLGISNGDIPTFRKVLKFLSHSSNVARFLIIVMTTFVNDDRKSHKLDPELLDALVVWYMLYIVFKDLASQTIKRLDSITLLERSKEKTRNTAVDLRIIAVSFSCLLVSIIMLASSTFVFTLSPLLGTSMFHEALFLHVYWVFVFIWVLIRTFKNSECEEARRWLQKFYKRTHFFANFSELIYWSFLIISLFVINQKFLALLFISRCNVVAQKLLFRNRSIRNLESLM